MDTQHALLADRVAGLLAGEPEVRAVALGGSRGAGGVAWDEWSDMDLEVFTRSPLSDATRARVLDLAGAPSRALPLRDFWGSADEWRDPETGINVDVTYFDAAWMADQLDRVLVRHEPSLGYSTCFWHTIRGCEPLFDRDGWLGDLRERAAVDYPEALRHNIVDHNLRALRGFASAWEEQVGRAARRGDLVSVNHRLTGLLASYFDVLFALNRVPHPGEKRLLCAAVGLCPRRPPEMEPAVTEVLRTATSDLAGLPDRVGRLLDSLVAITGSLDR